MGAAEAGRAVSDGAGPIRLVVSDVDGTLTRSDKSLSQGVVHAVGRLMAQGVDFTLISARPPSGLLWIAKELGLTAPLGAFNGGTIVRPDGRIVSAARLTPEAAATALRMIEAAGAEPWLYADGKWYARKAEGLHPEREERSAGVAPTVRADYAGLLGAVDKMVAVSDDHAALETLEGEIAEALGAAATVSRSQLYYLDITAPGANKGVGLQALTGEIGVPLTEVAVFGDQHNDLPMFARAGLSVCMGQSPQDVRARADYVARSNNEDGVADAIDRFVLPRVEAARGGG